MKIVVDYDECASNAVCMGIAPEVFEVRDDGFLYVLNEHPRRGAAREGPPGGQRLPDRRHHHRRGRVDRGVPETPRGSASPPRPPATSTSAAPGRPCSTGWWPASPAAPSSSASRTPTPSATARSGSTASSSALHWLGMDARRGPLPPVGADRPLPRRPSTPSGTAGLLYACDCTRDEIDARNKAAGILTPGYDGYCRDRGLAAGRRPGAALRDPRRGDDRGPRRHPRATSSSPARPWTTSWP